MRILLGGNLNSRSWSLCLLLAAAGPFAQAAILTEGFDNVADLTNNGWVIINNSSPLGPLSWFQGNSGVFPSQAGVLNAYAAANLNSTGANGDISTWLLSPVINVVDGDQVTFYSRTVANPAFPDRLELRFSTAGASSNVGGTTTSVGDFTTLLLTINPSLTTGGYPTGWTSFTATFGGLGGPASGRLAFRYFVTDGGTAGNNSDYIGIDTLAVTDLPEPATWMLAGAGVALMMRRRAR